MTSLFDLPSDRLVAPPHEGVERVVEKARCPNCGRLLTVTKAGLRKHVCRNGVWGRGA